MDPWVPNHRFSTNPGAPEFQCRPILLMAYNKTVQLTMKRFKYG